jgi:DNA repair protein RadD
LKKNKNYSGSNPGQNLSELVENIGIDSLPLIVGTDVCALVNSLPNIDNPAKSLRSVVVRLITQRTDEILAGKNIRKLLINELSFEKHQELKERLGLDQKSDPADVEPSGDSDQWNKLLGFFGINSRSAAPNAILSKTQIIEPNFGLFPHQRVAADKVFSSIEGGRGRLILHMPTGSGKTRTAMHVICRFLARDKSAVIVWLANSAELLEQAADAFEIAWENLGNRNVTLNRCWGDYNPDLSTIEDGILIAGFQKLYSYRKNNELDFLRFGHKADLVVVDEAHQSTAPTYRKTIEALADTGPWDALIGLTATPGRTWSDISADEELSKFFYEKKVVLEVEGWDNPVEYLMDEGYLARPSFNQLQYDESVDDVEYIHNEIEFSNEVLEGVTDNLNRNLAIIDEVLRFIENGHKRILIFGSSVRHGEVLSAALSVMGFESFTVTGATPKNSRSRMINTFRGDREEPIILCNFGVLTTGFDAPKTSAAIIARPTKSLVLFSQMVGRAIRGPKAGGNATCEISTVVDVNLPGFGDVAEAFVNWEDVWNG